MSDKQFTLVAILCGACLLFGFILGIHLESDKWKRKLINKELIIP